MSAPNTNNERNGTPPGSQPLDAGDSTTAGLAPALRQRDPPIFSGTGGDDLEEWLSSYDRVSKYNRWTDALKLTNIAFYLSDHAKTWFLNHEQEVDSWAKFCQLARDQFGRTSIRKADAAYQLSRRAQLNDESYTSYIEDVLRLCAKVDSTMTDSEKIRHVRKGISEDGFQLLVMKAPKTIGEAIAICQYLQEARNDRIRPLSHTCSPGTGCVQNVMDPTALRTLVRDIVSMVRDEFRRVPGPHSAVAQRDCQYSPTELSTMVREEVINSLNENSPPAESLSYADVVRLPAQPTPSAPPVVAPLFPVYQRPQYSAPPMRPFTARSQETRTCFYCGIRGHIARFCRKRQRDLQMSPYGYRQYAPFPGMNVPLQPPFPDAASDEGYPSYPRTRRSSVSPRRRSPSPRPRRSPERRPFQDTSPNAGTVAGNR